MVFLCFRVVFLCFSYGFPMVFVRISYWMQASTPNIDLVVFYTNFVGPLYWWTSRAKHLKTLVFTWFFIIFKVLGSFFGCLFDFCLPCVWVLLFTLTLLALYTGGHPGQSV